MVRADRVAVKRRLDFEARRRRTAELAVALERRELRASPRPLRPVNWRLVLEFLEAVDAR